IKNLCKEYLDFLDSEPNERQVLNFINDQEHYLLIASLLKLYNFGHHEAYLFKEFQLGTEYIVDYLLVGKGSGGYQFIFIELEHPSKNAFLKETHDLAEPYRKGINQINDWKYYLELYSDTLIPTFKKAIKTNDSLPEEFTLNDSTRRHYVVVCGRRKYFEINQEKSYRIRRQLEAESRIKLFHYDNLYNLTLNLIDED
ncbi:Shedu anti-phage system protein SduA domain-containing protein, partial [Peribacillus simplex]|uniref:Shedu anti-phage system protein SduA domain-containing protein n=1 Tax=Peribacillus simplex TaxID=1478 RepID=UPI001E3F2DA3